MNYEKGKVPLKRSKVSVTRARKRYVINCCL